LSTQVVEIEKKNIRLTKAKNKTGNDQEIDRNSEKTEKTLGPFFIPK
jgi:hypothetical protein